MLGLNQKNKNKDEIIKDIIVILMFVILFFILFIVLTKGEYLWGAETDWRNQHVQFADYFRKLFYDTFDFFPNLALNIGAGQNIYYFLYYGLFSPFIILSFLFPHIEMYNWLQFIGCVIPILSATLMYFYVKKSHSYITAFSCGIILLFSGPLIFHGHRHYMFVDYIPFIIMALFGIDRYLKENKIGLLVISLFLIIASSYFYSVGAFVGLFLFYIYKLLKYNVKINFKEILKLSLPFILAILLGAFILLPVAYTLIGGRTTGTEETNIINLLKLSFDLSEFLYTPYSLGLSMFSFVGIIYMLLCKRKKENIFLGIVILLFSLLPIFNYVLNGFLYEFSKSLIPLIPIIVVFICDFIEDIYNNKLNFKFTIISSIILLAIAVLFKSKGIIEISVFIGILILYKIIKTKACVIGFLIISLFYICYNQNLQEDYVKNDYFNERNTAIAKLINENIEDNNLYRITSRLNDYPLVNNVTNINEYKASVYSSTSNENYTDFIYNIGNNYVSSKNSMNISGPFNPLTNMFLGVKYIISDSSKPFNSTKIATYGDITLYENNDVLPIGYATSNIITTEQFNKLNYPNTMINLMKNIVVDNYDNTNEITNIENIKLNYEVTSSEDVRYIKKDKKIIAGSKANVKIRIKDDIKNKLLLLRIKIANEPKRENQNLEITINGNSNVITSSNYRYHIDNNILDYTIYNKNILNIRLTKGTYIIEDIETYLLPNSEFEDVRNSVDEFVFDSQKTKGDKIVGDIKVSKNGYFTLSIPYDEGFSAKIDGKKVDIEKVNNSFIGFKINKGTHNIEIKYEAPYERIGLIISTIGIILIILCKWNLKNQKSYKCKYN